MYVWSNQGSACTYSTTVYKYELTTVNMYNEIKNLELATKN